MSQHQIKNSLNQKLNQNDPHNLVDCFVYALYAQQSAKSDINFVVMYGDAVAQRPEEYNKQHNKNPKVCPPDLKVSLNLFIISYRAGRCRALLFSRKQRKKITF